MERTLAAIMAHFEPMWKTFVAARGSFEPFMDLYLDRWLHSYVFHSSSALLDVHALMAYPTWHRPETNW